MTACLRPARMEDAAAVAALCNADEARFRGAATHDLASRLQFWQRAAFRLESDTRVVELVDGSLVGYAVVQDRPDDPVILGATWVDPTRQDPAIQDQLLNWLEARARNRPDTTLAATALSQKIPSEDESTASLLKERNYRLVRHFIRMRIDMTRPPSPGGFPEGIDVRALRGQVDLPYVSIVCQDAFREHWGHVERTLAVDVARYEQWWTDDPQLDPALWHLAFDGEEPVGACLGTAHWPGDEALAYIFTLGVRPDWRGRGIGKALLQHALHVFHSVGRPSVELDVDAANVTDALRLYESVGMFPKWRKDLYELALCPA